MTDKKKKQPLPRKKFTDEQTDKRIHEHLTVPGDIISEEDIRNVRTDIDPENVPEADNKKIFRVAKKTLIEFHINHSHSTL